MVRVLALIFTAMILVSCAPKGVRYSQSEISSYPEKAQEHIRRSEVSLGMTQQQVRHSWGAPAEIRTLEADADSKFREAWIYKKYWFFQTKFIFTGGTLTEIISEEGKK